jgi:AcrR family transcriptional regulator
MPRITEEAREARREQILDAARACLLEHGLEAVSMEMIIARSGLSTGAVYRYFKGKDDIMAAAVQATSREIGAAVAPILLGPPPGLPSELVEKLLSAWSGYARSGVGAAAGVDRMPVALHGWSYAQTDPELKATLRATLQGFRELCVPIIRRWQADGAIAADADPDAVAQLILTISLGFVAQRALVGDADVRAHADALTALSGADPKHNRPGGGHQLDGNTPAAATARLAEAVTGASPWLRQHGLRLRIVDNEPVLLSQPHSIPVTTRQSALRSRSAVLRRFRVPNATTGTFGGLWLKSRDGNDARRTPGHPEGSLRANVRCFWCYDARNNEHFDC